ncbi:MAG: RnfABCDGE type electron transport complex subunit B, partial [Bacteroidales bacterium]|nr:RnfABCDGE type electron transport complex subunit B [Bacteroidales bacterium]
KVAEILGLEAEEKEPMVAVLRCSGSKANAPKKVNYDGPATCVFANNLYAGENGCPYGCLGLGDCVVACKFDAMYMDKETGLPVIIEEKCVACGACVEACPRNIIELRNVGKKSRRIFVSCINEEKGGVARKNCKVACIGCSKCYNVCKFDAITMKNNLAYIDYEKCKLCRKCVEECPTGAIHELNFPPRKPKPEKVMEKQKIETVTTEAKNIEKKPEKDLNTGG